MFFQIWEKAGFIEGSRLVLPNSGRRDHANCNKHWAPFSVGNLILVFHMHTRTRAKTRSTTFFAIFFLLLHGKYRTDQVPGIIFSFHAIPASSPSLVDLLVHTVYTMPWVGFKSVIHLIHMSSSPNVRVVCVKLTCPLAFYFYFYFYFPLYSDRDRKKG